MEDVNRGVGMNNLRIVMFPWLAHGHISPFLELSKRFSDRNITIYFCSTPVNLLPIQRSLAGTKYSSSVHLVELHLSDSPDLPPHLQTTKHLPPSLLPTLKATFDLSAPAFADILSRLQPDLVIYDFLQPWVPGVAFSLGIPAVMFSSVGAAMNAFTWRMRHRILNNNLLAFDEPPFPELYLCDHERPAFARLLQNRVHSCLEGSVKVVLIKTFPEIEAKYMDDLSLGLGKKVMPVGPIVEEDHVHGNWGDEGKRAELAIIQWLDKRRERSTVFVSFGSEYLLSSKDRTEIAHGLEQSEVNFIWAIRLCPGVGDGDHSLQDALPEGFLERVKERAYVTECWAPQPLILSHPSTGGFLSHCGWGSMIEAMRFGVPTIAMPMHLDQPINARLMAEGAGLGIGVEVERGRDGKIRQEEVARAVRKVMVEKGGEGVRRRAKELREEMERRREMGQEDEYIDRAVEELLRACGKTNKERLDDDKN